MKRIFRLVFLLVLICSTAFADSDDGSFAPLSPRFLEWQQKQSVKTVYSNSDSEFTSGYIPIPIDLSHLAKNPPKEPESTVKNVKADTIPSKYDLRNVNGKNYVPSVKNQSPYGACWAFAALGAMESNYMMQGNSELDLSEMQVAYFTFKNADKSKTFGNYGSWTFDAIMDHGGNALYPTAMLARLDGPTSESSLPYGTTQPTSSTPDSYPRVLRLREVYYLSIWDDPNVNENTEQRDIVKRRIMQNGAVAANYYNDNSAFYKPSSGVTTYHTTGTNVNHAIQIIGWDDNFSKDNFKTKPSINGAWLIKNSWGNQWYTKANGYVGDSGCFWMSYETYLIEGNSFIAEKADANMKVYEYDHLGTCKLWGYNGNTIYAANVFKSERDEKLTEIGVYTGDNNLNYEINVYKGMSSMPTSSPIYGSSASKKSGTIAYAGYHTITLDSPVTLSEGEYFSVVVKYTGYGYVPVESAEYGFSDNAVIETGSFFSRNGSSWITGASKEMNACVKAFTTIEASAPKIADGYLPDGQVGVSYSAQLSATGTSPITWSVSRNSLPAGLSLNSSTGVISGTPTTKSDTTFTITATNAYGSDSKNYTMNIWDTVMITTSSLEGYVGYAFSGQLKLSTSASATWQANSAMPSGLTLNASTGAITGKPTKVGTYTVSFSATTSAGTITKDIEITIKAKPTKPTIKTNNFPQGYIGTEYSETIAVTGTEPITLTAEGLPNGLTMNSSGYISGTPSSAGTFSVKITAENEATELSNTPVTKTLKLEILAQPPVLDFSDSSLPNAVVGEAYSYTFELSEGTEPFSWQATGLPKGLKISQGTLSGTPTKEGKFTISLTVWNSSGKDTLKVPLTVLSKPTIKSVSLKTATTGKSYSAKISATGTAPISWNVEGLPDTLEYKSNAKGTTLTISGTPDEVATYSLTITAANSAGSSSATANLSVLGIAPKFSKAKLSKGTVGSDYMGSNISATGTKPIEFGYTISASDKKKFGIEGLDDLGLTFDYDGDAGTAEITGTPTRSVKSLPITISASNNSSNGKPATKTVRLTIAGVKPAFTDPKDSTVSIKCQQKESVEIDFTVTGTPDIAFTMSNASGFTLRQNDDYTATLSGIAPSTDGKLSITVTATNADGKATKNVTIQTLTAPKITTTTLKSGTLNKSYSLKLGVTGTKKITWSYDGDLPNGMKFKNGAFSGKPKESGTFALSVTAENEVGSDTKEFTLTITDPNAVTSAPDEEPEIETELEAAESESESELEAAEPESESEPAITFGTERDAGSLSAGQVAMLNDSGYVVVKILPEMRVSESGMYDIDVDLDDDVETGAVLLWFAFPKDVEATSDDEIAEFYDESGAEIEGVPESHRITVGVWLTEGVRYEPVIAVKK